jgi:hypothetical protein
MALKPCGEHDDLKGMSVAHSGDRRFAAALVVAQVFKLLAVVAVVAGVFVTQQVANAEELDATRVAIVGTAGTAISAAFLAFFGFVIELLVEICENTRTRPPADRIDDRRAA